MALVYSYLRFSNAEQASGDSRRRQLALSDKWCKARGLTLDDSLRMSDEGISAYEGRNIAEGALREFLSKLRNTDIRPGSYLLVESLDRISRESVFTALGLFSEIIRAGVKIVTLQDGMEYTKETIQNIGQLIYSLVVMSTANEESRKRSLRLGEAWKNKKGNAGKYIVTSLCPCWLKICDGKFIVLERKARLVRDIIRMSADGMGIIRIMNNFNMRKIKTITGRNNKWWCGRFINNILKHGSPIGNYRPHTIINGKSIPDGNYVSGYYPAIVSKKLYEKSLSSLKNRTVFRNKKVYDCANLFTSLVKWGHKGPLEGKTLYLMKKHRKNINGFKMGLLNFLGRIVFTMPYKIFENIILRFLREIDLNEILQTDGMDDMECRIRLVSEKICMINIDILSIKSNKYNSHISKKNKIYSLSLEMELRKYEDELQDLNDMKRHKFNCDNRIKEILEHPTSVDGRQRLAGAIRRTLDSIYIYNNVVDEKIIAVLIFKGERKIEKAISINSINTIFNFFLIEENFEIVHVERQENKRKSNPDYRRGWTYSGGYLSNNSRVAAMERQASKMEDE